MGLTALFPPEYTGAFMSGNGVAGIVVGLLRIITKASLPNTTEGMFRLYIGSFVYFLS